MLIYSKEPSGTKRLSPVESHSQFIKKNLLKKLTWIGSHLPGRTDSTFNKLFNEIQMKRLFAGFSMLTIATASIPGGYFAFSSIGPES